MKRWIVMLLVIALLLAGCTAGQGTTGVQLGSAPTVEDIFTIPPTTRPTPTGNTLPGVTDPVGTTQPSQPNQSGGMGFGPNGTTSQDEYGHYYPYDGGEICMPFMLQASGMIKISCVEDGVGILIFLDGQPQPYRVGADGELGYFHILYPAFDASSEMTETVYFDLYFTPVSGEKGQMVEFFANPILCPQWTTADPQTGFKYTFGSVHSGSRLKMNAAPPKAEKPEVNERIKSVDIVYKEASYLEIGGWSDSELIEKYSYKFRINGEKPPYQMVYNFTASDSVELRFEVWGTPYVKYGLMFYIDNQPISAQQEILFDMKNGQKTVITVTVDLSDFDGECVVYAALIPRNCRSTEIHTYAFLDLSSTYILIDDPAPAT